MFVIKDGREVTLNPMKEEPPKNKKEDPSFLVVTSIKEL